MLGKYNSGSYQTVKDIFDTSIEYPEDAYNPYYTDQKGYAPYLQLEYCGLNAENTYKFKITRNSGNAIRLFGAIYFTGITLSVINPSIAGMDWDILRRVIYNAIYKSEATLCFTEAPIYHDHNPESQIRQDIEDFIGEFQKYNIPLVLMSCSPGGWITKGSDVPLDNLQQ